MVDIQLDFSPGEVTPVQVLDKHEYRGRHSHTYDLYLPAWGPRPGRNSIEVSSATYSAVSIGDSVCLTLHPGAIGLPWFDVLRDQALDDHAVLPGALKLAVIAVDADLLEARPRHQGQAGAVFRKMRDVSFHRPSARAASISASIAAWPTPRPRCERRT